MIPPTNRLSLVAAVMATILLPVVALGSMVLADATDPAAAAAQAAVENLAGKSISYWFVALAVASVTSWTFVVRWGLNQLESQRQANLDLTKQLVGYLEKDRIEGVVAMQRVTDVLSRLITHLDKDDPHEK